MIHGKEVKLRDFIGQFILYKDVLYKMKIKELQVERIKDDN